ncbi:MAG: flavodoxin family protein [Deltaproteobacteria bacterium]|nr:flavodoxin family protein [Deltaproteobacteria bacterium]
MYVMAFNGSPRKKGWNTVTLIQNALKGAESAGAEIELVQLYDLNFSGCLSCFSCKKLDRKEDGVCSVADDLTPVLDRIRTADAMIIGTPLYWGSESAATRAFLERLLFPCSNYSKDAKSLFPKRIKTAMIYTMGIKEDMLESSGFQQKIAFTRDMIENYFGPCELLLCNDTLQYSDYDKYESEMFDKEAKLKRHTEVFPIDCQRAFELGVRMASGAVPERNGI